MRGPMPGHRRLALAVTALAVAGGAVAVAQSGDNGRIGPDRALLNNGRHLQPFGTLAKVGQFPTGAALTPNGRYYWTVSTGRGRDDVRIVSVRSGRVVQTLALPGASGGIAMDPRHPVAYVSGVADSAHKDQQTPPDTPGRAGDVIHVMRYSARTGTATEQAPIPVPAPSNAQPPQDFPPTPTAARVAWPGRLAVSPDGARLLVPLNLADQAAIVDTATKRVRYVATGSYPYGAAILRDGHTGLVSNEAPGTVSVIDLDAATKVKDIQVGPHLSHPEAIAVDPKADRAYVAVANSDQVSVLDTKAMRVERTLSVERPEGLGTAPVDVAVTAGGGNLLVAEAGGDEIAVFQLPGTARARRSRSRAAGERVLAHEVAAAAPDGEDADEPEDRVGIAAASADWRLIGRIPTAQYPTDVDTVGVRAGNPCGLPTAKRRGGKVKGCAKLVWLSGKGLGVGPNPEGPNPAAPADSDDRINSTQYLPLLNVGAAGIADYPSRKRLARLSATADRQIRPSNAEQPPAGTPLRADGPIKHVFYIVRENRSYDQIMGDDARGDGDPKLTLFGDQITPNAHALARRFPLLDHFYANSEASIDGHFWTSAAKVSDYVNKNWFQNYAARGRPYDFGVYAISWPANGFLFDQAERQGISYYNYGEAIAGDVGLFPDKDRTPEDLVRVNRKFAKSDLGANGCFANDTSIGTDSITGVEVYDSSVPVGAKLGATSRFDCLRLKLTAQIAAGTVPALSYITLPNDHTRTLEAGARTPRAMIADNDEALGKIVDLISHSAIWQQSAIFVVEDDSQDGADHVDAHRIPAFVVSQYAKQGAVVHTRYDFLSAIRSMELILGMKPLGLFDRLATPMYDAFTSGPANAAAYDAIPANVSLVERNPGGTAGALAAAQLPPGLDRASQADMDRLLWQSVHGNGSTPPPSGPDAEGRDPRVLPDG
jgi:DNA-binding beta-propeller fold protein YncE